MVTLSLDSQMLLSRAGRSSRFSLIKRVPPAPFRSGFDPSSWSHRRGEPRSVAILRQTTHNDVEVRQTCTGCLMVRSVYPEHGIRRRGAVLQKADFDMNEAISSRGKWLLAPMTSCDEGKVWAMYLHLRFEPPSRSSVWSYTLATAPSL